MPRKKKKLNLAIKILIVFLLVVIIECCFQVFLKSNKKNETAKVDTKNEKVEDKDIILDKDHYVILSLDIKDNFNISNIENKYA